ncbi:hypothetical protein RIE95_04710 [Acidithiobacillus thiooxidans]|uniref:Uncharacterized protein n=1 Tax=Acidithiobacillus thiooxidans ATCC 19377 TaxID=637390 RepID=A0A543Q7C5_ACITH|nr:hypothetical protein [Acidithiobacillus thiooxidans]MDR7926298.1 hypothetical protein [Acidithiobacillus thiooxidans]MDX5936277.1 hypothetical protein [Acidithiobacillus thiooxidans]TQN52218.1 hypothetical protein DLNHIDIE_02102 [Acidithiobacillus thiooxidans ATCC 19377]
MPVCGRDDWLAFEAGVLSWAKASGWRLERTGPLRRNVWPVPRLEFLREGVLLPESWDLLLGSCALFVSYEPGRREAISSEGIPVKFYQVEKTAWGFAQIAHSGPADWVTCCRDLPGWDVLPAETESAAFARIGLATIPPSERRPDILSGIKTE